MQFILASGSPRRRELLASLGVPFTVIKSDIDETQHTGEDPYTYVRRLSLEKAEAVAARLSAPALVLAADTVVILAADIIGVTESGVVLGKPVDADDARDILRRLRGRDHVVCTALTLLSLEPDKRQAITELTRTTVTMRDYTNTEIDAYIATGDPFDKAGAYAIQHEGFHPVERIEGIYNNVVGLPLETLRRMFVDLREPKLRFRMPIEEFLAIPETMLPTELIDGFVYARGSHTISHQDALLHTTMRISDVQKQGMTLPGPIGVHLDNLNFIEPDVSWISPERANIIVDGYLHSAPDLVAEVLAPDTALRDKREKFRLYEKHGTVEYWLIDPKAEYIEVWRLTEGKFIQHGIFGAGETFVSAVLGDKTVEVSALFGGA
jgi:septum formation protein